MKVKIRLDTMTDVNAFVNAVCGIEDVIYLTDGKNFTVSAKSVLGAIYTMEWNEVYCTCEKDIYRMIQPFIIEE